MPLFASDACRTLIGIDLHDFRMPFDQPRPGRVQMQFAKAAAQRLLLRRRYFLVSKKEYAVFCKSMAKPFYGRPIKWLPEINALYLDAAVGCELLRIELYRAHENTTI